MMNKIFLLLVLILGFSLNAHSQEPFVCNDNFFQVFTNDGALVSTDIVNGTFTIAPNIADDRINAMGLRLADKLAYGMFPAMGMRGRLVQLSSDGTAVDLGLVTDIPIINFPAGDFASDGLLYVYQGAAPYTNTLYGVDVTSTPPAVENVVELEGPAFITADIAFNPRDRLFYAVSFMGVESEIPPGLLLAIDIDKATVSVIGPTNIEEGEGFFASMFGDGSGRIYGGDRSNGLLYEFDTETGNATLIGETIVDDSFEGSVDGFYCSRSAGPFPPIRNIPTLSEWGLIATAGVLGIISLLAIRKRKITA